MEFFNHIHSKYTGVKGFVTLYNDGLRYRYMITEKAKQKAKILSFWAKHGLNAALDAFPIKRPTLFLWKKKLKEANGNLEALNDKSRAPKTKRKRIWPDKVQKEIKRLREEHPNLGKDKISSLLYSFCLENGLKCPKSSTIGRLIRDAGGLRTFPQKISHFGRIKSVKRTKKLRKPKGFKAAYPGHLVELDTIERFVFGIRCYIITFVDVYSRFSFAWAYRGHSSLQASDFFEKIVRVFPCPIHYLQTDNGSEFAKHFSQKLKAFYVTHFHIYPKMPQHNSHVERYNRTIQEEYIDYHSSWLPEPDKFNQGLIDYLLWYNTKRPHWSLNLQSPLGFILESKQELQKSNIRWTYTTI